MRHTYLQKLKQYRIEGYQIVWQDETWANSHATLERLWQYHPKEKSLLPVNQGSGGPKVPSGAGRRIIINHAGGAMGFLDVADIFIGQTGSGDYHTEMNTLHCLNWFETKVLPALPSRSVLIIDNAKYHNKVSYETKKPNTGTRKAEIQAWLQHRNIALDAKEIKAQLLEKVKQFPLQQEYETDRLARQFSVRNGKDIKILRLPIGHCEVNPIELIWSQLKCKIAEQNRTFKIKDVHQLAQNLATQITPHDWQKCISHVEKTEREYWDADMVTEIEVEPLIIDPDDDDGDNDDESEDATFSDLGFSINWVEDA